MYCVIRKKRSHKPRQCLYIWHAPKRAWFCYICTVNWHRHVLLRQLIDDTMYRARNTLHNVYHLLRTCRSTIARGNTTCQSVVSRFCVEDTVNVYCHLPRHRIYSLPYATVLQQISTSKKFDDGYKETVGIHNSFCS
jgi:hypothetical protein